MVYMDPMLSNFVIIALITLILGLFLKLLKSPSIIAYILTGVLIGPYGLSLIKDDIVINQLGNIGIIFLMFFIGMEISVSKLLSNWKISILGTAFQITVSVLAMLIVGKIIGLGINQIILLGFVISLSSTAVLIKLLKESKKLNSSIGRNILGILLVQDIAVVPMIITLSFLASTTIDYFTISLQIIGSLLIFSLIFFVIRRGYINLPFSKFIRKDPELKVFAAFILCFTISMITGLFQLSTALGAFIGGIIISYARETHWVSKQLETFRVLFVALFFISVGLLIDLRFVSKYIIIIAYVLIMVFLLNTTINACILRVLGNKWRASFITGAYLAQIGEFSFVLISISFQTKLIGSFAYNITIAIIALSLAISPFWIKACQYVLSQKKRAT
jgi:monovalent cation:H+ antiporter-2, CPA2 family